MQTRAPRRPIPSALMLSARTAFAIAPLGYSRYAKARLSLLFSNVSTFDPDSTSSHPKHEDHFCLQDEFRPLDCETLVHNRLETP